MTKQARCTYCGNDPGWCSPGYCCPAAQLGKERDEARAEVERLRVAVGLLIHAHFDGPKDFAAFLASPDAFVSDRDAWQAVADALGPVSPD